MKPSAELPTAGQPPGPVILAIETAGLCGSLALVAPDRCLAELSVQSHLTHSRRLLAGLDTLLIATGLGWPDIDALAISLGPGSFTGLRIGLATAKGLAMAAGKPLIGVPTLDGLAAQVAHGPHLVGAVLDARKQEVYAAFYRPDGSGACPRIGNYLVLAPDRLAAQINEPVLLVGDGAQLHRGLFQKILGDLARFPPAELCFPRAAAIGHLALHAFAGHDFLDPATAIPIYVRASEAELLFGGAVSTGRL